MISKQRKTVKRCPLKVGDKVKFIPSERTIGWYQHSFDRLKIYPGYVGTITKIKDGLYVYLDNNIGGFPWIEFKKLRKEKCQTPKLTL